MASDASICSWFGRHVGTAGDVNADGYDDIWVGAPQYSNGQTHEGKVFGYHGSDTGLGDAGTPFNADWTWEPDQAEAALTNHSDTPGVAPAGDVNGDGYDDLLVGSFEYDAPTSREGLVAVWLGSASGLGAGDADWVMTGENEVDLMGFNVASAGDFNGDGFDDVVVGVGGYDDPGDPANQSHGRAFIWFGSPSGLLEYTLYEHSDYLIQGALAGDSFGLTMAGVGDFDGDDLDDVVVSAWYYANPRCAKASSTASKGCQ